MRAPTLRDAIFYGEYVGHGFSQGVHHPLDRSCLRKRNICNSYTLAPILLYILFDVAYSVAQSVCNDGNGNLLIHPASAVLVGKLRLQLAPTCYPGQPYTFRALYHAHLLSLLFLIILLPFKFIPPYTRLCRRVHKALHIVCLPEVC